MKLTLKVGTEVRHSGQRPDIYAEIDEQMMASTLRALRVFEEAGVRTMGRSPGHAREDIRTEVRRAGPNKLTGRLYTVANIPYWLSRGTGIYGPHRQRITPRTAKVLRWQDRATGRVIYARSVKGIRGNRWLERAGDIAEEAIKEEYRKGYDAVFGRRGT